MAHSSQSSPWRLLIKTSREAALGVFKMPNRVISNGKVQKSVILDKNLTKNLAKKFRKTWCPKFLKNLTKN